VAFASVLAFTGVLRRLAGTRAFATVDAHAMHRTFGGGRGTAAPFIARAMAAMARLALETILFLILDSPEKTRHA